MNVMGEYWILLEMWDTSLYIYRFEVFMKHDGTEGKIDRNEALYGKVINSMAANHAWAPGEMSVLVCFGMVW